jgi:hypothetical protein
MKAYNICWVIDYDFAFEILDYDCDKAIKSLEISKEKYMSMSIEERHDYAYDIWRHCPAKIEEFLGLPDEVEIPECVANEVEEYGDEVITEYLADTFGTFLDYYDLDYDS